jgi:hydroxypyruvate reductase
MNLRGALARALSSRSIDPASFAADPRIGSRSSRLFDVIAIGKAAARMVAGLMAARGAALRAGVVVLPDHALGPPDDPRLTVLAASHPFADERSVRAGEAALALAREGTGDDLFVLVSGGASSLAFVPVPRLTLGVARSVAETLLASGADVRSINVVRRHLSLVHGGGLLRAAFPRSAFTVIESDVIGGEAYDVGSGPSVADPTTVNDARRVLARYAPSFVDLPLVETLKPHDPAAARSALVIAGEPARLAEALAAELRTAGATVRILPPSLADAATLEGEYNALARSMRHGEAFVRSAEPSLRITIPNPGAGGRCTHLAALVARDLPSGVAFLAAASDGVDGASGTAGALVRGDSFLDRASLDAAIARFDTGPLHRACLTALPMAPTGLNLADVHALARDS